MAVFRLANVARDGQARPTVLTDGRALDVGDAIKAHSLQAPEVEGRLNTLAIFDNWDKWRPVLERIAAQAEPAVSADGLRFLAPILYPRKLLLAGANYTDHMAEMGGNLPPKETMRPYFFMKPPTTSIIAPKEPVMLPEMVQQADWEAELVAVIGRPARRVKQSEALNYVAGYTVLNDISSRDRQRRTDWGNAGPFAFDWMLGKCWQGFAPMGPSIVPSEFIKNPHELAVRCSVNGELMQNGNTRNFLFNINELIEYLSELFLLEPGDCISTGTPAGVGRPRGIFLKDGDLVTSEVEDVCLLETPIRREK